MESPSIRNAFINIKPSSIDDLSKVIALVGINDSTFYDKNLNIHSDIIYEDDLITYIMKIIDCSEEDAEIWRRKLYNKEYDENSNFLKLINNEEDKINIIKKIKNKKISKSYSLNLSKLIWLLTYYKYYRSDKFWESIIKIINTNNSLSSKNIFLYKKDIYLLEDISIYNLYYYQNNEDNMHYFRGLIISFYQYKNNNVTILTIYYNNNNKYLDIIIPDMLDFKLEDKKNIIITGICILKEDNNLEALYWEYNDKK